MDNRDKENINEKFIYKIIIEVDFNRMLNFTSTNWGNELDVLELFLEVCKKYNIHFGIFLDLLIDKFGVEIDAIAMIDLRDKSSFIPIISEHKTLFAFGDIQICIKGKDIIKEFDKC